MADADGIERGPSATPEDFVKALEKREMTRLQVPKVNIFHFNEDRVSEWLELLEQVTSEASEADKFKLMPRYVWWELRPEVMKVAVGANGEWAKFKEEMQRRFKLGDVLLTKEDLEMLRRDKFSTVGAFATTFEKMTKKVPGLAEEEQCATFLGHFKNWEGSSLTKKAAPGKKLTWAPIKEGVMDGELDQVDIFQMREARKKRKALDATTSDGRDFKKMIEDAVAQLDAEKEAKRKTMAAPQTVGKAKKAVVQEEEEEEEEEEPEPQKLTEAQRKARNLAQGGQGSGRGHVPQAMAMPPPESSHQAAPAPYGPWLGGHRSTDTTYLKIAELYFWDGMGKMIDDYCKSCVPCQERSSLRPREPLHPRYVREVGAVVHLDLLAMPQGIGGFNFIFDARDNFSGFVDERVIRTKTGETLAHCIKEYYLRYPFVSRFVMDRGSEFTYAEVKALLLRYGVIVEYTTATHPEANAPVERGHSTISNLLAKWTSGRPNQWPDFLRVAFFVDNITVRRSTGYAPATLWYGRHATFPIESFLRTWRRQNLETELTFEELLDLRARQIGTIEDHIEGAANRLAGNRAQDKYRWDQMARVRKEPLKVGDIVLLYDSSLEKQWSRKLDKRWLGPYKVAKVGEYGAYQIEELNGTAWRDWVSGSRLKKFVARDEPVQRQGDQPMAEAGPEGRGSPRQEVDEDQAAREKELERQERAARDREIGAEIRRKNLEELYKRMEQEERSVVVKNKKGKSTGSELEDDPPLISEAWANFDRLMGAARGSEGPQQEMGVKLVYADLLTLRGTMKEGFAAARALDQRVGERLTKVA
ncbi:hypothetical protein CBR_g23788 [Chara braunii]|uniref:Integrase catalytic domain-containing protein n=1 Tax=Chara braunii TaxID=69332 RepID=A0A388JVT5_CHABU|nr:hypothetical protein CBR_g23788 [Chara braunii]|eukprot:GBG61832.1 hypothetical protein CBR_g23788 [Chara braunii]